jgi:hypothetical protein
VAASWEEIARSITAGTPIALDADGYGRPALPDDEVFGYAVGPALNGYVMVQNGPASKWRRYDKTGSPIGSIKPVPLPGSRSFPPVTDRSQSPAERKSGIPTGIWPREEPDPPKPEPSRRDTYARPANDVDLAQEWTKAGEGFLESRPQRGRRYRMGDAGPFIDDMATTVGFFGVSGVDTLKAQLAAAQAEIERLKKEGQEPKVFPLASPEPTLPGRAILFDTPETKEPDDA